jgi:hypothetical protein
LRFAKIDGSEEYACVHSTFNGKILIPLKSECRKNLSYNELCLYIEETSSGKDSEKFHLHNGITFIFKRGIFAIYNVKLSGLNENELEKLLVDTKLDEKFKDKIITDVKI